MQNYTISGDFYFNRTNIQSMEGLAVVLHLAVPGVDREQHIAIKNALSEKLGMRAHSVPEPWGDNPVPYHEIDFETKNPDLCKHLIALLKSGGVELKAGGIKYPPDSDHPLFAQIDPLETVPPALESFAALNETIGRTIDTICNRNNLSAGVDRFKTLDL